MVVDFDKISKWNCLHRGLLISCDIYDREWPSFFYDGEVFSQVEWELEGKEGAYVFFHTDSNGVPFFAGMGEGVFAWNVYGGTVWEWFLTNKMFGELKVVIFAHSMSERRARDVFDGSLSFYGLSLLNHSNFHRGFNYEALSSYNNLKKELRGYYDLVGKEVDCDRQFKLALCALEIQYRLYELSALTESGRYGLISREMSPCSGLGEFFLGYVVKYLISNGRLDEARGFFNSHYSRVKIDGFIPPPSKLQDYLDRGSYRRKGGGRIKV